jgi:hypothetical protein
MKLSLVVAVTLVATVSPSLAQGKGKSGTTFEPGNSGQTISPGSKAGTTFTPGKSDIQVTPGSGPTTVTRPAPTPSKK